MRSRKASSAAVGLAALLMILGPAAQPALAAGSESVILNVDGMWAEGCEEYIADSLLGDLDGFSKSTPITRVTS